MISYEVSLSIILMGLIISSGSLNLAFIFSIQAFVGYFLLPIWPLAFIYFVSMLAETNRAPFDLSEGESELVSGYNVEYSSMAFALFFLAEYSHIIFSSFLFVILFMGGLSTYYSYDIINVLISLALLVVKGTIVCGVFIWVRTSFPRLRYDQVMALC